MALDRQTRKVMSGVFTYTGVPEGHTVIKLTDGSVVGASGNIEDVIREGISNDRVLVINHPDGEKIILNPNHIVHAFYTPEDE